MLACYNITVKNKGTDNPYKPWKESRMKDRTLFYVKTPDVDLVVSKEAKKETYRILRSDSAFRTFPKIRWCKLYAAVEDCDYIEDAEWVTFIYKKFLASLRDDNTVEWDTNNGIGYTWKQLAEKIEMSDDLTIIETYKE